MVRVVNNAEETANLLLGAREALCALGVRRLSLFGSFARGAQGPESDVDVVVDFAEGAKTYARYMAIADHLEGLLGRPVDLLTRESMSEPLRRRVLREAIDVPIAE